MIALVERLVIGSGAGTSAASFLTSLPVSGVSATKLFLRSPLPSSDVEPRSDPDVLDREQESQQQLYREQEQNRDGEELERHVLKQAGARQKLPLELARRQQPRLETLERSEVGKPRRGPRHQYVEEEAADEEDEADHERAEYGLPRIQVQERQTPAGDHLVQVAVAVDHDGDGTARLPRPE